MMNVKCQRYLYEHRAVFLSETDLLTGIDIKALIQNAEKEMLRNKTLFYEERKIQRDIR